MTLKELSERAYKIAHKRGKTSCHATRSEIYNSIRDELNEFKEAMTQPSKHISEFTEIEEELADVLIATLTGMYLLGVDVDVLVQTKMLFNNKRED